MKRRKKHARKRILLLIFMEILFIFGFLAYLQLRPMVVKEITIEAGAKKPDISDFLLYENRKGSFLTDMEDIEAPGSYQIKIKVGNKIQTSTLNIVDTIPPKAEVQDRIALRGEALKAEDFVTDIQDATEVAAFFSKEPDTSILGEQKVVILLKDSGNNLSEFDAVLNVLDIKSRVTIEAGSVMDITVEDFKNNENYDIFFITDLASLDTSKPALYQIQLSVDGNEVSGEIEVVDTTAPEAEFAGRNVWKDEKPEAMTFVSSIKDASEVTAIYKYPPDFGKTGSQKLVIMLEDQFGNRSEGSVTVTVKEDKEGPVITGVSDKTVYIGDSIAYKKGITVADNKDSDLTFSVDSSAVNLKKEGVYPVIYTAKDKAGNKASAQMNVTVIKKSITEDVLNEKADDVLEDIITDDMTSLEKAKAIYNWTRGHISYTGDSDKSDWMAEAYRGMTNFKGDCFTYYTVAQALLTRAGIDNMGVTRVGGRTRHYWNLVNCGSGWYHFDSCPNKDHRESFMLTDKEVEALTKIRGNNYYTFDHSLYPATPEE